MEYYFIGYQSKSSTYGGKGSCAFSEQRANELVDEFNKNFPEFNHWKVEVHPPLAYTCNQAMSFQQAFGVQLSAFWGFTGFQTDMFLQYMNAPSVEHVWSLVYDQHGDDCVRLIDELMFGK